MNIDPKKQLSYAFLAGFSFCASIHGLMQDWMGLQGYLEHVKNNWINTHWVMFAVLAAINIYLYFWLRGRLDD